MKKLTSLLLLALILLIFALVLAACGGDNGNKSGSATGGMWLSPNASSTEQAANATATYGAEVLEIQLTAIADKKTRTGGMP